MILGINDNTCCICIDTIAREKKLECGHAFCMECIDSWITKNPTCPLCNDKIQVTFLQRIRCSEFKFDSIATMLNMIIEYECTPMELCCAIHEGFISQRAVLVLFRIEIMRQAFMYTCLVHNVLDTSTVLILLKRGYMYALTATQIDALNDYLSIGILLHMKQIGFYKIHKQKLKKGVLRRIGSWLKRRIRN